jgi:hypothetical protein
MYGPISKKVVEYLTSLDNKLSAIINRVRYDSLVIITGDHGCRQTEKYLVECDKKDSRKIVIYESDYSGFNFKEDYVLDCEKRFKNIQFDGGILRIWFEQNDSFLSEADRKFLLKYGKIINTKMGLINNSKHPNLGDIVVEADHNITFCKHNWINDTVKEQKIPKKERLLKWDLPKGEHGTSHPDDRYVHFMSNYDFEIKELVNVDIKRFLEDIFNEI